MCDDSIEEDSERYRRNNVELAVALNDLKMEFNIVQTQLLERNRELQKVYDENATLKRNLAQKDNQISSFRSLVLDMVKSNTRKYTEVMQNVGLVSNASGGVTSNENPNPNLIPKTESNVSLTPEPIQPKVSVNVRRRQRENNCDMFSRLSDLTEESIRSQTNDSKSFISSPEVIQAISRRRASASSIAPPSPSPLRDVRERLILNGETKGAKTMAKVKKMEKIIDENTPVNTTSGRPTRKTAPRNLSEPKLGTKLRRD